MNRIKNNILSADEQFIPKRVTSVYCSDKCSKKGYKQKKEEKLKALIDKIPEDRLFISVPEATLLFGIAKTTLYHCRPKVFFIHKFYRYMIEAFKIFQDETLHVLRCI